MIKPGGFLAKMRARASAKAFDQALADLGDVQSVSEEIERDFSRSRITSSPFQVGRELCCFARGKVVLFLPIRSLVWAYGDRTLGEDSPFFESIQITLWPNHGPGIKLPMTKADTRVGIEQLAQAAPWLPVGYSPAMLETWNNDRPSLIAMIDRARSERRPFRELFPAELDPKTFKPPEFSSKTRVGLVVMSIIVIGGVILALYLWDHR